GAQLTVKFSLRNTSCRFNIRYLGTSRDYPYIGVIISFPEAIHIEERRRRDRRNDAIPAFDSGIFKLKKGSVKDKTYEFRVINCSAGGVGIQVGEKDSDLLERVKEGDKLQDITLYAPQTVVRMDGTVRHKSKIRDMENENSYILGVEFDETLKDFSSL
ncbi:MAG: PilZ domain-containing protein, partial [Deltaproteobacteria bacterium]